MTKAHQFPVSKRALVQRINRVLAKDHVVLKTMRSNNRSFPTTGEFYTVDLEHNWVISKWLDLESFGKELKVLEKWGTLVEE